MSHQNVLDNTKPGCDENLGKAFQTHKYFLDDFFKTVEGLLKKELKASEEVKITILKGGKSVKGDYFISLKNMELLGLNCDNVTIHLRKLPYISHVDIDSNRNLLIFLNRLCVYKACLQECKVLRENYGMTKQSKSLLIVTDELQSKGFLNMRMFLLAEHIACLLSCNGMEVYHNITELNLDFIKKLVCSDNCDLNGVVNCVESQLNKSCWRRDSDNDGTCLLSIDARSYIEKNKLQEQYGNTINTIYVSENKNLLSRVALIKHIIDFHMVKIPDLIIHVASQGQSRFTKESSILLDILSDHKFPQMFVFNQTVQCSVKDVASMEQFKQHHTKEVTEALCHKYDTDISQDPSWIQRVEILVDTAVKFEFLKANHCMVLNLRGPSGGKNLGIFVQYNFARLCNIFKNFEIKVQEIQYSPLPALEDTDFSLLRLDEEWVLLDFVLQFPLLVHSVVDPLVKDQTKYRLNKICLVVWDLCIKLSLYYSRTRILGGALPHQQNLMHARLWLLKAVHRVFLNFFKLLNIQGLDQM